MKALKWNGYPKSVVETSCSQSQQANTNTGHPKSTVVLPYIHGLSEPVRRILVLFHVMTRLEPCLTSLFTQKICVSDPLCWLWHNICWLDSTHPWLGVTRSILIRSIATRSTLMRSTLMRSTLTWSTCHEINFMLKITWIKYCGWYMHLN